MTPQNPDETRDDEDRGTRTKRRPDLFVVGGGVSKKHEKFL